MICENEQGLAFDELTENIWGPLRTQRYPISGTIELTERCNYACVHCYINQPAGSPTARQTELTTAEVKHILDQLVDAGCLFLLMTGGEPLIRPDFGEIFRYAREKGLLVTLFTNGSMLTPEIAAMLVEYGLRGIEISIYGATAQTHERLTRTPGSFERCLRGIQTALDYHLPLSLKTFVLSLNQQELPQMRAFAAEQGLNFRYDSLLWPRLDGKGSLQNPLQLDLEEMIRLDVEDPERLSAWKDVISERKDLLADKEHVFSCGAAYHAFHIDAHGNLSPCAMVRNPCYNLLDITFPEAWEKLGQIRTLKRQKRVECLDCTSFLLCNQCPAWSQAMLDDLETPVPFLCELTRQRVQAIEQAV